MSDGKGVLLEMKNITKEFPGVLALVGKSLLAFPTVFLQSAARIISSPAANKFHTCSL